MRWKFIHMSTCKGKFIIVNTQNWSVIKNEAYIMLKNNN